MRTIALLVSALGWLTASAPEFAPPALDIKEWPVPWPNTFTRDPYVAPDGRVFFCGMAGNYVGVLDTTNGQFKRFELPNPANPHNLIIDAKGIVWYAGNRGGHIGRLDPATGQVTKYPMPDSAARDPHTLAWDPAGDIWFTVQGSNFVGKLMVATGAIQLITVPTSSARPYGIVVEPSGRPWIALFGTNKLATVDPRTFALSEVTLPRAGTRVRRLALTSDGRVWYADWAGGFLGVYDPKSARTQEWAMPGAGRAQPYAMVVDAKDRLWIVETGAQPNRFVGFDTKTLTFLEPTPIPSGAGTVRHMVFEPKENAIWFATDAHTVGRARLP
ncbi:MAG: virginiamycin B lyase family protein [Gemmatimonadales bacterium]